MDVGPLVLMDLLWCDPTESNNIEALRSNARGLGLATFGPDRVPDYFKKNKLQLIIRAHEYYQQCWSYIVIGRELMIVPKLIHPIPPPLESPETSPERLQDDTWMQVIFCMFSASLVIVGNLFVGLVHVRVKLGPVQWLKPYTDEVLVELGKAGVKSLLAVPVRLKLLLLTLHELRVKVVLRGCIPPLLGLLKSSSV
ncbi:Serine/threonine-protein phosphatase BSL1 [Artemisia annua]|uniref:Serine/threonine-protein phosphatase BSL1 n=1 Tax=Artemisia annua TaxID=35608 RepID=A0A2U1QGI6_ARTAN|nr:Serine/threonine-protein phosphatase BSL1 [Artemisia annua]